jgi:WhiB family redox-sensing transcriptional regulator
MDPRLPVSPEPTEWWARAACYGHDPEWWSDDLDGRIRALRICAGCPVRDKCLQDAIDNGDFDVIRGGVLLKRNREGRMEELRICPSCGRQPRNAEQHRAYAGNGRAPSDVASKRRSHCVREPRS